MAAAKVTVEFGIFRAFIGPARPLDALKFLDFTQSVQMQPADGLITLVDGSVPAPLQTPPGPPPIDIDGPKHVWLVRQTDVVHAPEHCAWGKGTVNGGAVKHSNLSGGQPAFVGGELYLVAPDTLLINGWSGRYGTKTKQEMDEVGIAFRNSGYHVWSMGADETGKAVPFGVGDPIWV